MTTIAEVFFWSAIALTVYVFAGYPLALAALAVVRRRDWVRADIEPAVSIVVSAHNEAGSAARKVENLLSLDYPADKIEILVGSDGSTDSTVDELSRIDDPRLRVSVFSQRRGKPSVLNALASSARNEIIVFADVRQTFEHDVLRTLVRSFADARVGAVTGELMITRGSAGTAVGQGSGFYWRYEKFIRSRESLTGSTIVVTGAIYAIRRELFEPIPADTIIDDLLIPLRIARHGHRVVFERAAHAHDVAPSTARQEFTRKVRTLAGAFQLFARERWVWSPLQNPVWWQTMSHKAMRLLVAPMQVAAFGANLALAPGSVFYQATLVAQALFYAGAVAGLILPRTARRPIVITLPYIFCLLSWATVVGFARWISSRQTVTWQKATPNPT